MRQWMLTVTWLPRWNQICLAAYSRPSSVSLSLASSHVHSKQPHSLCLHILTHLPSHNFFFHFTFFILLTSHLLYKLYFSETYFWLILGQDGSDKVPLLNAPIEISILRFNAMHCNSSLSQLYWIHLEVSTVYVTVSGQCIAYLPSLPSKKCFFIN